MNHQAASRKIVSLGRTSFLREEDFGENWLMRWLAFFSLSSYPNILDLGCGYGDDSRYLANFKVTVVSVDISRECLVSLRRNSDENWVAQVDIGKGLPFKDSCFQIIISNLSFHFFGAEKSKEILAELSACLVDGGLLLLRLNSTRDIQPKIANEPEIESHLLQTRRLQKRFYNKIMVEELFRFNPLDCASCIWQIVSMEEIVTRFHQKPKVVWEIVVRKKVKR